MGVARGRERSCGLCYSFSFASITDDHDPPMSTTSVSVGQSRAAPPGLSKLQSGCRHPYLGLSSSQLIQVLAELSYCSQGTEVLGSCCSSARASPLQSPLQPGEGALLLRLMGSGRAHLDHRCISQGSPGKQSQGDTYIYTHISPYILRYLLLKIY